MWPAVTQKMSPSKWALRDPLLKIILPGREMNPGCVTEGVFTLVCVCTGREGSERGNIPWVNKWLLYLHSRMMFQHKMWFQFEALGSVTLDNGHLQSELPVPGSVFQAVWFSHFVQWVHICICEGIHMYDSYSLWNLWRISVCDLVWSLWTLWFWLEH